MCELAGKEPPIFFFCLSSRFTKLAGRRETRMAGNYWKEESIRKERPFKYVG